MNKLITIILASLVLTGCGSDSTPSDPTDPLPPVEGIPPVDGTPPIDGTPPCTEGCGGTPKPPADGDTDIEEGKKPWSPKFEETASALGYTDLNLFCEDQYHYNENVDLYEYYYEATCTLEDGVPTVYWTDVKDHLGFVDLTTYVAYIPVRFDWEFNLETGEAFLESAYNLYSHENRTTFTYHQETSYFQLGGGYEIIRCHDLKTDVSIEPLKVSSVKRGRIAPPSLGGEHDGLAVLMALTPFGQAHVYEDYISFRNHLGETTKHYGFTRPSWDTWANPLREMVNTVWY
ncbi:hypothetical protein ACPV5Q_15390 [Vibrio astriarenae]